MRFCCFLLFIFFFISCSKSNQKDNSVQNDEMYFPSLSNLNWETKSITSLGWNENAIQPLKDFLIQNNTKSFMILINGRIVIEEYFDGHSANHSWEWNSTGKTLAATATGIAQQEGLLNINNKVSSYLDTNWTSMPLSKENLITVKIYSL